MIPSMVCRKCGGEVEPADAYCPRCGEKIEWPAAKDAGVGRSSPSGQGRQKTDKSFCPLCGQGNRADASICESCGAALGGEAAAAGQQSKQKARPEAKKLPGRLPTFFQSWKFPAALALVAVILIVVLRPAPQETSSASLPPGHDSMVKEIQELQKQVEGNPRDAGALLKLANVYFDQRMFPRAIDMYNRFLELNPGDPNARVDLGTSYFELGLIDSTRRDQYLATAKSEMEKALTYAPKHQLAYYNLGMVNLHTGDLEIANEWFKKCLEIDSTSAPGQRAQQLLKQHLTTKRSSS